MPTSDSGKAISSRNATTHGLFSRDVVLPSLGEDPDGYHQLEAEWTAQLVPRNLLERHYVEKIAAASWRLRRLHRWQAQISEDATLTEAERLDRLTTVLRHETALHRQIDTAVKLLTKDVPHLYTQRVREQVLEDNQVSERECREDTYCAETVDMETRNRLYRMRKATAQATHELSMAPLDAAAPARDTDRDAEKCQNEPEALSTLPTDADAPDEPTDVDAAFAHEICQNEPPRFWRDPRRVAEYLDPDHKYRSPPDPPSIAKRRRLPRH